jgi:tricarballylate dehydrogenase
VEIRTESPVVSAGPSILVAGAGAAGLVAAVRAHQLGASVAVVEKGLPEDVGGNARFSGGLFLFPHTGTADVRRLVDFDTDRVRIEPYPDQSFIDEVTAMSDGRATHTLVRALVERSRNAMQWLHSAGVGFQLASSTFGAYASGSVHVVPAGPAVEAHDGGVGLVDALLTEVVRRGIPVHYECPLRQIVVDGGAVVGASIGPQGDVWRCDGLILTTGGFEANPDLRMRYLGPEWGPIKVRGTRHNTGEPLLAAFDVGAAVGGDLTQCHSVSVDANGVDVPGPGEATPTRLSRVFRYGILVNAAGERFFDEGEDLWTRIYSKMGRAILGQPGAVGFHIFDAKVEERVRAAVPGVNPIVRNALDAAAHEAGIDPAGLRRTVDAYNDGIEHDSVNFDVLDGHCTQGIALPKSNWALRIDEPPFLVYPANCGITFTHGGLAVEESGRVLGRDGGVISGLFAAGEITGGLFFGNYPGGSSLMRSTVFGLTAAEVAVEDASQVG